MQNYQRFALALIASLCAGCAEDQRPVEPTPEPADPPGVVLSRVWVLQEGLDRPESVVYDAGSDVFYVTNIVGEGDVKDGNGYIAKVSPDGSLLEQEWVGGLNAPKGLTIGNDRLYATDIDTLMEIDLDSGEVVSRHVVEGDVYLNDVTVGPDGDIYATDSRFSKIYRLTDRELEVWLENTSLQMPNGIHVVGGELYVAAGDRSTENPGAARYLQAVSLADKSIRPLRDREPAGALDAVEPDGKGGLFVTDWSDGRLMHFTRQSGLTLLEQLGDGAADVDYIATTRMLYVPVMHEGQLIAYEVAFNE